MSDKKKVDTDNLDSLDIRLVRAWVSFRSKISDFCNNMDECTVDLHFESSLDPRTHFSFEPDEAVFINDVEVSNFNEVIFVVPFEAKTKSFNFKESELISATYKGEKKNLIEFINGFYRESFKDVPEASSITILERKYLATNVELRDLLNNGEEAIKQFELNIERKSTYSKLDDFGMF